MSGLVASVEITSEMIAAAALVLVHQFDCSQGIAEIVVEDMLRAALRVTEFERAQ